MSKVFISYGNKDRQQAEALCAHLEGQGIPCWIAPRDITSGIYAGEITRAIKSADVFVVLCSKETRASDHVKNEVNLAVNNTRLILPYCLDNTPFDDDLEYYLSSKQRIVSCGDARKDFRQIERVIREFRGEAAPAAVPEKTAKKGPSRHPALVALCALTVLLVLWLLLRPEKTALPE